MPSLEDVFEALYRVERPLHSLEIVRLVEPLVRFPDQPVERDGVVERGADQWSRR